MKTIITTLFIGMMLWVPFTGKAQNIDGVINGIKAGNVDQIINNAGENLSLTILDKNNTYSKAQAQQIIKDFFAKNSVKAFELKHKGNSPNGKYAIGTLSTSGGNYRVNIFMKADGSKEIIKELRFQLIE